MAEPVFSETGFLPGAISLLEQLDKRILVQLRDGKILIGTLRTIDQFANLVLQSCVERIYVDERYGEIPRGIYMVRGENVVLAGEIDERKEHELDNGYGVAGGPHLKSESNDERIHLRKVPVKEILALERDRNEARQKLAEAQTKALADRGMVPRADTMTDDNY